MYVTNLDMFLGMSMFHLIEKNILKYSNNNNKIIIIRNINIE